MITIEYTLEYHHQARTLNEEDIGTHSSGWTIEGRVWKDYYTWVNGFVATHPIYGKIEGDFEDKVTAEDQQSLDHFLEHHPYSDWDYWDI